MDVLPQDDRAQFVTDFVGAFQASAEIGEWSGLAQTITEWRNTAAIHADPQLAKQLAEPLDIDPIPSASTAHPKSTDQGR